MSSVLKWKEVAGIPSDRAALAGQRIRIFVVDELSGEELERITFLPAKTRCGYCLWTKDCATSINARSSLVRAGVLADDGTFRTEASSYLNRIHAAIGGLRVFTTALHQDNWVAAGSISLARELSQGEAVVVQVRNEATGKVYETLTFTASKDRAKAIEWRQDLARHINDKSLYIQAGRLYTDSEVDKEKMKTAGQALFYPTRQDNKLWIPKGSELKVTCEIVSWRNIGQIRSDRGALPSQKITAFVIDEATDEELERITFTPDRKRAGYCVWTKDFASVINAKSALIKAGVLSSTAGFNTQASSYTNRLHAARSDIRVFTTSLHQENWVDAGSIPARKDLAANEAVIVRVCNNATGKVYETLLFTAAKDRTKVAEWRQDLARHINARSAYARAGRLYTDQEVDREKMKTAGAELVYPSATEANRFWVPAGSYLKVTCEVVAWIDLNQIRSDRAAPGRKITAFVLDDATDEVLESLPFTPAKGRESDCLWTKDFAASINSRSKFIKAGVLKADGSFKLEASSYLNRIYTLNPDVRAFTTGLHQDNWVEAGSIPAPKDLKQGDVLTVRVSGPTGRILETLSFTVGKDRLKAIEWRQDLARHINDKSVYLKAGRPYTDKEVSKETLARQGHELFYASTGKNIIWVPRGSGLSVELDDWLKESTAPEPIPYAVEVDPLTGNYQANVKLGTLVGNKGQGPSLDLVFNVSKQRAEFQFSFLSMRWGGDNKGGAELTISLSTGEMHTFNREWEHHFDTIVFSTFKVVFQDQYNCKVIHRDGTVEVMLGVRSVSEELGSERLFLPTSIKTPTGHGLNLSWIKHEALDAISRYTPEGSVRMYPIMTLLRSIKDDDETLLEADLTSNSATITLYPGNLSRRVIYDFDFEERDASTFYLPVTRAESSRLKSIASRGNVLGPSSLKFEYKDKRLSKVESTAGAQDTLTYDSSGRVRTHGRAAGELPGTTSTYGYSVETDPQSKETRSKITIERQMGAFRSTDTFVFDKQGRLVQRTMVQGDCSITTKVTHQTDAKTEISTVKTDTIFKQGSRSRTETSQSTFDTFGNIIKRTENGITKEWTYFSGEPTKKRIESSRQRVDAQASVMGLIFGWAVDFANPIGWGMNIFSNRGFTWGTDYEYEIHLLPSRTTTAKATYNLPMDLVCPGDPNFFTWLVASERVYTQVDGKRVDLHWSFFGYGTIAVKAGDKDHPAILPTKKLTLIDPVSADGRKADSYKAGEVEELQYYGDPAVPASHGRVKKSTSWLLDEKGSKVDNSSDETSYAYKILDGGLLETTVHSGLGSTTNTVDTSTGQTVKAVDRFSNVIKREHDAHGRLKKVVERDAANAALGEVENRYEILPGGTRIETHATNGGAQRVHYDLLGRPTRTQIWISPALGWRTLSSTEYDGLGRISRAVECDYHLNGRLLSRDAQRSSYDDWGQLCSVRGEGGGWVTHVSHDPIARTRTEWTEVEGVAGPRSVTTYHSNGAPLKMSLLDAKGTLLDEVEHSYTAKYELSQAKGKHLPACTYEYDHYGRRVKQDVGGIVIKNQYPAHIKKAIATKATIWDGYDYSVGAQVVDEHARVTRFERNGRAINYTYNDEGQRTSYVGVESTPSSVEPLRPAKHEQAYDAERFHLSEKFQGKAGLLVESSYRYSLRGRSVEVADPFAGRTYYRYDRFGRYVGSTNPLVYATTVLDGQGRVREETVYDKFSAVTATIAYRHDALGRETERCIAVPGFDDFILRRTLDGAGRLIRADTITTKDAETLVRDERFSYDSHGRLEKYVCNKGVGPVIPGGHELMEQTFQHDSGGMNKFLTKVRDGKDAYTSVATDYTFRAATQTGKISTGEIDDMIGAISVLRITHDDHGRLSAMGSVSTRGKRVSLSYNKKGRLHAVEQDATQPVVSYAYDYHEKLVSCISTEFTDDLLYRGGEPYGLVRKWSNADLGSRHIALLNGSAACHVQRVTTLPGKGSKTTRHTLEIKDAHGSLVASYDLAKKTVRTFAYTPYGYRKVDADDTSWKGFNGLYLDSHLGGIYHPGDGYRVYDPTLQRYHAPDGESPFGLGGANSYAYCYQDPVNNMDPSGRVVVGRDPVRTGSYLSDPLGNEIFFAVIGIGLGIATGGASLGLTGAFFGGVTASASAGLGFAALATESSNPDLSTTLRLFSFAVGFDGTFGSIKPHNLSGIGRGIAAGAAGLRGARAAVGAARVAGVRQANGIPGDIVPVAHGSGSDIGNLYVGGAHTRRLVINGHGFPTGTRFPLPKNTAMEFYSPKGAYIRSWWDDLGHRIDAGPMRPRVGKVDSPDYYLSNLDADFWQKANMPAANLADMPAFYRDLAIAKGVDILEVTNDVTLSMVFDWLQTQNKYDYGSVAGHFCRGTIKPNISEPLRKIALRFGLEDMAPNAWYAWWT
ncbi:RHS repeat-associated core domain-containing protein [Stenotrophomonas sp. NPDC047960]|uniref:RHS repeat-associated core domain-containing protein n=1 Tax=Stenotrophomonas sp. NPDC047960 TaxID=3364531 RepID=UPI0037240C52